MFPYYTIMLGGLKIDGYILSSLSVYYSQGLSFHIKSLGAIQKLRFHYTCTNLLDDTHGPLAQGMTSD